MITFYKVRLPSDLGGLSEGSYVIVDCEDDGRSDETTRVYHFNTLDELAEFRAGSSQDHPKSYGAHRG